MTLASTVVYDNNGNTLTDPSGKSYTWDFENRLMQAVVPGTGGGTTTFKYDPFGRRVQKSGPLGTTNYLYDGTNALEELDQSGNLLARYTQGGLIDEPFSVLQAGTTSYYQTDGLGSITSLSNSTGALANTYSYDNYGKLNGSSGAITNRFQYTAREFDQETGTYFYRARYYDQAIGRFLSEDPTGFPAGPNFYSYTKNNPVNAIDPTGLRTQLCCRPVNDWRAKMAGAHHCFLAISGNPNIGGGGTTIVSLLHNPPTLNGTADVSAYSNGSSSCVDVPSCSACGERRIVDNASNPGPSGPANYFALGPNSNTYVRFLLLAGECTPPAQPPAWAPGYNDPISIPRPPLGRR